MIPATYEYVNYSQARTFTGAAELQKTILSVAGAFGFEIQKRHFGAFIEGFGNYGLGSIYNSTVSHLTTTSQTVDAKIIKVGARIGLRLW